MVAKCLPVLSHWVSGPPLRLGLPGRGKDNEEVVHISMYYQWYIWRTVLSL